MVMENTALDAAPSSTELQTAEFIPTAQQMRYLAACLDPRLATLDAMATAARINRVTIWRWRQDARFVDWLTQQIARGFGLKYHLALDRALDLAIQGSPEHLKLLMGKFGDLRHAGDDDSRNGPQQVAIHINVPRPAQSGINSAGAEPMTFDITPRPMLPPTSSTEQ